MFVEDYILNGDCDGCDRDQATCYANNCCYYETKESSYKLNSGEEIFYVTKAESGEIVTHLIVVKRVVDSLKEIGPDGIPVYWLNDMWGNPAKFAPENELFKTKQEAIEYGLSKMF